jgi:Skp family chaperone for outer membrane proteins
MPLKLKVEKLEDVEEGHRGLYVDDKEGGFALAVDGLEDTGALKRAVEHERNESKLAKERLKKMEDEQKRKDAEAQKLRDDAARSSGDVKALEESWTTKHTTALAAKDAEYQPQIASLTSDVNRLLVDNVAQSMASELAVEGCAGAAHSAHQGRVSASKFATVNASRS